MIKRFVVSSTGTLRPGMISKKDITAASRGTLRGTSQQVGDLKSASNLLETFSDELNSPIPKNFSVSSGMSGGTNYIIVCSHLEQWTSQLVTEIDHGTASARAALGTLVSSSQADKFKANNAAKQLVATTESLMIAAKYLLYFM